MNTEQEVLYQYANKLSHDTLDKFLRTNGVDRDEYMAYRKRQLTRPVIRPVKKAVKAKILREQGGVCNFCHDPIPHGCVPCFDRDHGDVLCRRCTLALVNVRALGRAGLTFEMIRERLGLDFGGDENV